MKEEPVLIYGAGAIGGTIGGHLARAGYVVTLVDRDRDHVKVMREQGLSITGPVTEFKVKVNALTPDELAGVYPSALLCVKAQDTEAATEQLRPHLSPDGYVVSVQNGLNEYTIAAAMGAERTIGCFINFDADYLAPGIVQYSGHGAVVVGELNGRVTARLKSLHQTFLVFDGHAQLSPNIFGYLWSKLAYAAMLFATALTNESIADCLALKAYQELFIALAAEVLKVAVAEGTRCEPFDGFVPDAFYGGQSGENAVASLAALAEHNRRSAKSHSGIWRDLAVRKRRTEVDAQLGMVVSIARKHGLQVPLTKRLMRLIHEIEDGCRKQGISSLAALAEAA